MCGIFGVTGDSSTTELLIRGLKEWNIVVMIHQVFVL